MKPQHPRGIPHHHLIRLLRVIPIPRLKLIPRHAQLPPHPDGHDVAIPVDNLGMGMGHQCAHCRQPLINPIVRKGVEAGGGGLGQPIAARELGHAESVDQELHQVSRDRGAGNDSRAQRVAVEVLRPLGLEEGVEHGGHAMDGGALLIRDGFERRGDVEDFGWVDNLCAVGDDGEEAKDEAEAVEQRGRTAQNVFRGESHSITNKSRIVDQVATSELVSWSWGLETLLGYGCPCASIMPF